MAVGLYKPTPFKSPSPLKQWGTGFGTVMGTAVGGSFGLGGGGGQQGTLEGDIANFRGTQLTNAWEGMQNPMIGLGQGNRLLSMTNPFAGMGNPLAGMQTEFENKFEDIGVNTKAAELAQKQFQQNQAAQLEAFKTMGISGSQVQEMANASLRHSAQQSADLGTQEREGKIMSAKGASQVQAMEAEAKQKKLMAGHDVDKMIRQGQFDVDKLVGTTQLDIAKTTREGEFKTQQLIRGGRENLQNLDLQKQQGLMALLAGMREGERAADIADKNFFENLWG